MTIAGETTLTSGVAYIVDATVPTITVGEIETTSMDSDLGVETFLSTKLANNGEFQCTVRYDATQEAALLAAAIAMTPEEWTITMSDSKTIVFDGFITKCLGSTVPMKGVVDSSIVIKITGDITITA